MTEELKKKLSDRKISSIPTKDWFLNFIDIGDVIIIPNHSMYDVGKVVSLSESGMTITCYRPEKTKGTAYPSLPPIGGNRFWALDVNISKVKDIIANHNSTLYKRLYGGATDNGVRVYPFVINLSKLPHHESIED